jgi:hypothetical protein
MIGFAFEFFMYKNGLLPQKEVHFSKALQAL